MKYSAVAAALVVGFAAASASSRAATVEDQLAELRQRIETLEAENQALRQSVDGQSPRQGPSLSTADTPASDSTESVLEPRINQLEQELATNAPTCPSCDDSKADLGMSAAWNHGLELTTADKAFRVHVGGRAHFDSGWYAAPDNVQDNINHPYENGVDIRRARLRIDGTMYETIDWAIEYEFFNSVDVDDSRHTVTGPTDFWWTFHEVPWCGNVRVGIHKPAIGFEHIVSSRFQPFMERSFNQDAFYGGLFGGFWPGVSCFDNWGADDLGTWNLGLFKPTDDIFAVNVHDGDVAGVSRVTRLLWYENNGANLFHVGGSALVETTVDGRITFRTRDMVRSGLSVDWPVPASTGSLAGDDVQWFNGELAAVNGPWTFQSEYLVSYLSEAAPIVNNVVQPVVGTVTYHGGYVQLLYFLTGEHDNYNKQISAFERVLPNHEFHFRRGCAASGPGAWQIGARYSYLDLNDNSIDGGILHNGTLGLNWYLNPNLKIQFDYMATHRDAPLAGNLGDGWINGWGIRVAHDF